MTRLTGQPTGIGYDLPPIGSAEIESLDDSTEFGLPIGYVDPTDYRGTSPDAPLNIGVWHRM